MDNLFALASTAFVTLTGVFTGASFLMCVKTREFTTAANKIETDAVIKMLATQGHRLAFAERWVSDLGWVPSCVVTGGYCASLTVLTSEHDPRVQIFEVLVRRPCCLPWAPFHSLLRPAPMALLLSGKAELPEALDHLVQGSANLSWPDWSVLRKSAHLPDTTEKELAQADAIARMALDQLHSNGSGVFLVRGKPMTGKTSAGMRLAQILGATVCTRFNPTRAGNMISQVIRARTEHSPGGWLIIFMDEVDVTLDALHAIPINATLLTEVTGKDSWDDWVDDVSRNDKVILWLTTNADDAKMASYDPALLREKRVTAHYHATGSDAFHAVHERALVAPPLSLDMERGHPSEGDLKTPLLGCAVAV
ncbi:MAG: hypothetical protein WDW38_006652 [Sanguina aurantia]